MGRRFYTFLWPAAAACLLGSSGSDTFLRERDGKTDEAKNALEGRPAIPLSGKWFNAASQKTDWESLKGKVVVLDFWTHWALSYPELVPREKRLLAKHRAKGLVFLSIHADPNKAKMQKAIRDLGITWPVLLDEKKAVLKAYSADTFPDYYLVDRKGVLRFADLANDELERAIEALLAESP